MSFAHFPSHHFPTAHLPAVHWPTPATAVQAPLANATLAASIRDRIIAVITALSPSSLATGAGNAFHEYRNEGDGDFIAWAEKNPAAAFRRFQVRDDGTDEPPAVTNMDIEERSVTFEIVISYPQSARTGHKQALSRDDVIAADFRQIDFAVGICGRINFSPPEPDAVPRGITKRIDRRDACDYLVLTETFTYRRTTT